jgi:hypothetical protein
VGYCVSRLLFNSHFIMKKKEESKRVCQELRIERMLTGRNGCTLESNSFYTHARVFTVRVD